MNRQPTVAVTNPSPLRVAVLASLLLGLVDIALCSPRLFGLTPIDVVVLLASILGISAALGVVLGVSTSWWRCVCTALSRRFPRVQAVSAGCDALPLLAVEAWCAVLLFFPKWDQLSLLHQGYVVGGGLVAAAMLPWVIVFLRRAREAGRTVAVGTRAALLIASLLVYWLDTTLLRDLYPPLHWGLECAALWAAYSSFWLGAHAKHQARAKWAIAVMASLTLVAAKPLAHHPAAITLLNDASFSGKVLQAAGTLTDLDRDGYSALFAGGDCDDFDATLRPGAFDLPSNGVDEDCSGADLVPRQRQFDTKHARRLPTARHHVIVIVIDALRADHLGVYGYPRNTTPNIDRLAQKSQVFTHAYSQSPKTTTSIAAIQTGRYVSNLVLQFPYENKAWHSVLDADHVTLPELLRAQGYRTCLWEEDWSYYKGSGLTQGIERQGRLPRDPKRPSASRKTFMQSVFRKAERPFFLWAHLYQPHSAYVRHEEHDFGPESVDRYDSEVATADAAVGEILSHLDEAGLTDDTLIVITADHGESLGELGRHHHVRLHEETLHVPLILFVPQAEPHVFRENRRVIDIFPTLAELVDIPIRGIVDGESLAAAFFGDSLEPVSVVSERRIASGVTEQSIREGSWRLTVDERGVPQLIDADVDPLGEHNLADSHREQAQRMREALSAEVLATELTLLQNAGQDAGARDRMARNLGSIARPEVLGAMLDFFDNGRGKELIPALKRISTRADLPSNVRRRARALAKGLSSN